MENLFHPLFMFLFIICLFDVYLILLRITTSMSISDGSDPCFFRPKMEKMRSVNEKIEFAPRVRKR